MKDVNELLILLFTVGILKLPAWSFYLFFVQLVPVYLLEVRMVLYIFNRPRSQTQFRVFMEQTLEKVFCIIIDFPRIFYFTILDVFIQEMDVVREKGRLPKDKLIDHNSQSEIVTLWPYSLFIYHFRRKISWATAKSFSKIVLGFFAQPKVYQKNMSIFP